jgi:hypothetical protein
MLNKLLLVIVLSLSSVRSHAEEVKVIELPVDLKVSCEYSPTKHEMVFLSNGNLRYFLPKDGKFHIKKYTTGTNGLKMFFQLEYSDEYLGWEDFDNPLRVDVKDLKTLALSSSDKIYLEMYISGEFRGNTVYGKIRSTVRLNAPKATGDGTGP